MGMTAENLRKSILQYVMEGKFVSQNPDDEPASVLMDKIYAEKHRLQKEGIIKRDKNESVVYKKNGRYYEKKNNEVTDITEELPFDIPDSWAWNRIVNIVTVNPRNTLSDEQETSFVEMSAIKEGYSNSFTYVVLPWGKIKSGYTHFRDGDVGFAKITPCFQNRKSVVFKNLRNGYGAGTTELHILRAYDNTILPDYLLWLVKSQYFIQRGISHLSGTAGQQRFGADDLKMILLPIPPFAEQERIVRELDRFEPLLAEYECFEKELSVLDDHIYEDLWKSILQYALEGKLVSQNTEEGTATSLVNKIYAEKRRLERDGVIKKSNNESVFYRDSDGRYCEKKNNSVTDVTDEIPFDIPESWSWCRLDDIVAVNPRNSLPAGQESSFVEMSAIKEGYCNSFTYVVKTWGKIKSGYTHFRDGDVGFAKITPCFQNRKSVVFRNLKNGYGAGTTELNILRPYGETILPEYLLWFVKSPYFIQRGISNLSGTAGQQRFGTDSVKSTLIPIPPYDEQKRIVDEIEKYESLLGGLGDLV